jgi:hypothetical protein
VSSPRTGCPRHRVAAATVLVAALTLLAACTPARAVSQLHLAGHGFGHGRGMGQWGALGYAVDHNWSGTQILDRFYGGTTTARLSGDALQRVQLSAQIGKPLIVFHDLGHLRIGGSGPDRRAVMILRNDDTHFRVFFGDSCGGPWHQL